MYRQYSRTACALFAAAVISGMAAPVCAQSLSLSYSLEGSPEAVQQRPAAVPRCAGFKWVTQFETCGRDLFARLAPGALADPAVPATADPIEPKRETASSDLPSREAARFPARETDLALKLGGPRGADDAASRASRFTDTKYEMYRQSNGHKIVGVELLVPFQ